MEKAESRIYRDAQYLKSKTDLEKCACQFASELFNVNFIKLIRVL